MIQAMLFVFSTAVAVLVSSPRTARWACIPGVISQPMWMWETYQAGQYGMLALSTFYLIIWIRAIYEYHIKKGARCETV
jgi:hypothetical protein